MNKGMCELQNCSYASNIEQLHVIKSSLLILTLYVDH